MMNQVLEKSMGLGFRLKGLLEIGMQAKGCKGFVQRCDAARIQCTQWWSGQCPIVIFIDLSQQVFVSSNAGVLCKNTLELNKTFIRTLDLESWDLYCLNFFATVELLQHHFGDDVGHGGDDARAL